MPVATFQLPRSTPRIQFTDTRLENGLRVIISEDRSAPVFSIVVNYNVGSRDERKGRTGFAHLFEHMMFKGSENVGPGEHPYLMFMNGGNMNGTTNKDRTVYYETLPANQLDLALFLEADRMRSLEITKENLENQRNAVQEERRLGVDNQPYGRTFEVLDELAYDNSAYEHSVIGSMADLNAATVEDVAAFFKTYYAPNNAVVAIVGDVEHEDDAREGAEVFRRDPRQPPPPPVDMTEPAQTAERRTTHRRCARAAAASRHGLQDSAWRFSRHGRAGRPGVDSLSRTQLALLRGHRSSKAVVDRRVAGAAETRGPGLFTHHGDGRARQDAGGARSGDRRGDRTSQGRRRSPTGKSRRRAPARARRSSAASEARCQRAMSLSQYALFYDKPDKINTRADDIAKVTAADVQRVARQLSGAGRPNRRADDAEGRQMSGSRG